MRSISLPTAAIACALALSPGAASAALLNNPNAPTWLQFRAAFAAEDLWPDASNHVGNAVKSKARVETLLDNRTSLDKAKLNMGGPAERLASNLPLPPGKTRQTFAAVN